MSTAYLQGTLALGVQPQSLVEDDDEDLGAVAEQALVEVQEGTGVSKVPALPRIPMADRCLKSELDGVPDEAWTDFVLAMKVAQPDTISASNEYGMFAMKSRRLADLGLIKDLRHLRSTATGRMVWVGEWVGVTREKFLADPKIQYRVFTKSVQDYARRLQDGAIPSPEDGWPGEMTLSGALAVLHKCGPQGFLKWSDASTRFGSTEALYERANGVF